MKNILTIKQFKNGYGIKTLTINNKIGEKTNSLHNNLIYAANGVFKSSFTNTFHAFKKGKKVKDRITNEEFLYDIKIDNVGIDDIDLAEKLIVFNNDIMSSYTLLSFNDKIAKLAVDDKLKDKINKIYQEINLIENELESIFKSNDFTNEEFSLFTELIRDNRILYLDGIITGILKQPELNFKLTLSKELFLSEPYKKLDNQEVRDDIVEVKKYIQALEKESPFDEDFTVFGSSKFLNDLRLSNYLNQNDERQIIINDKSFNNYNKFEFELNKLIDDLMDGVDIKKIDKILNKIGRSKNIEKEFRKDIFNNIEIINTLEYPMSQIISNELKKNHLNEIESLNEKMQELKNQLESIKEEAKEKTSKFENALDIYKVRFDPIFNIEIINSEDSFLGIELPIIQITHNSHESIGIEELKLDEIISSGERTTYNVLKFIVLYEEIKHNNPIVILDDVVDSFDYGNKYAFIEYIKEMIDDEANIIVLTNNFDFYKNLGKRIFKFKRLSAIKNQRGTVNISNHKGMFFDKKEIFNIENDNGLLTALPFVRELSCYHGNIDFIKYFHIKKGTNMLTMNGLSKKIKKAFNKAVVSGINKEERYLEALFNISRDYANQDSRDFVDFDIKKKLILALGIRLKLELILIDGKISRVENITTNQTRALFNKFRDFLYKPFIRVVNEVLILTPEFIHLNAFMYEPLIDVSPIKLKRLYKKIEKFEANKKEVWKDSYRQTNI